MRLSASFGLIVRAGHPLLLAGDGAPCAFPLLAPALGSRAVLAELRRRFGGGVHLIEDFASLSLITQATDPI